MKLGRFDYRVLGYAAAFTFGNPRGQSQKQKTAYRKGRVRAVGKRAGPEGAVLLKTVPFCPRRALSSRAGTTGGRDAY